jgi:hypothetical protein
MDKETETMSVRPMRFAKNLATVVMLCLMSAACAQNKPTPTAVDPAPQGDRLPYSIAFTTKGEPVVLGPNGRPLPPTRINFPIPGSSVKQVTRMLNFNAIEVLGSQYLIYCFGPGYCFCIDLPNPDGTMGNACSTLGH